MKHLTLFNKFLNESISDYSTGLITEIGLEQHSMILDTYDDKLVYITNGEIEFIKSKLSSAEVKFDSWGAYSFKDGGCKSIEFRYYRDAEVKFRFHKFSDDWWLFEDSSVKETNYTYRVLHTKCYLIDSDEGLKTFINWIVSNILSLLQDDNSDIYYSIDESADSDVEIMQIATLNDLNSLNFSDRKHDKMTKRDLNVVYDNIISKFISSNGAVRCVKYHNDQRDNNIEPDFNSNVSIVNWSFNDGSSIGVSKFVDDWWFISLHFTGSPIMNWNKRGFTSDVWLFWCDGIDSLSMFYKWLEYNNYLNMPKNMISGVEFVKESVEPAVGVLKSWRDFDQLCDTKESEKFNKSETKMISKIVDELINVYNDLFITEIKRKTSHLSHTEYVLSADISVTGGEHESTHDTPWMIRYINTYKFKDDWWAFEFYLPDVWSPEGGDTVYFVCDSRDGLRELPSEFRTFIEYNGSRTTTYKI